MKVIRERKKGKVKEKKIGLCCCAFKDGYLNKLSEVGAKADSEDEKKGSK